jgi:Xaa-Pro aminopeptidase
MKYHHLPVELFKNNRLRLNEKITTGGLAILHSNWENPKNGDAYFSFKQQSDLFYLTGVDQEDTIFVSFPDCPNPKFREFIFVKETNEHIAVWDGAKLTPQQVYEISGIQNVYWFHEFWQTIHPVMLMAEKIYVNLNENDRFSSKVPYANFNFCHELKFKYPGHEFKRLAPILSRLRMVKSTQEIDILKQAIEITRKGLIRALGFIKPGVMEFEIEAELIHEFIRNRSRGFAFDPIIASGASACVLHYIENNKICNSGDLLLLDFGAEYANYNGDCTRCIPVNGTFTKRQKEVYDGVLEIHEYAKTVLKPGTLLPDYHSEVGAFTNEILVRLGLVSKDQIKSNPQSYLKYFMHGTSHHLGLDVHDVMHRFEPIPEDAVLTIEPGIYIPEEGIGVRIENDVWLHDGTVVDLMSAFPITTDEIENLMH